MVPRRARALIGGASALTISLLVALPASVAASATTAIPTFRPGHALYDAGVHSNVSRAQAAHAALAGSTFTQFKAKVTVGTKTFTYVMAGKNPAIKVTNPSATIKAVLIPTIIKVATTTVTWDPTKTDSCDTGASPLSRTQKSPVFVSRSWTWGGTPIGTAQVTDAYQRANFWKFAKPSGINPGYHVNLSLTTIKPITITVPFSQAAAANIGCGNHLLGAININWLDPHLQKVVIPSLASQGVNPSTVPIFLLHNVVEFIGTTSNCCVLGYHNAFSTASGIQTYVNAMYDNSRAFTGSSDISVITHEVGEWMDDPYTNNPTPPWGHIGQVSGCQANLENGDPLTGTTFKATSGTFTYHPQELAFFSWFYHQSPSLGVNGWYSDQGKFKTFAAPCH